MYIPTQAELMKGYLNWLENGNPHAAIFWVEKQSNALAQVDDELIQRTMITPLQELLTGLWQSANELATRMYWHNCLSNPAYVRSMKPHTVELLNTIQELLPLNYQESDRYSRMTDWLESARSAGIITDRELYFLRIDLAQEM